MHRTLCPRVSAENAKEQVSAVSLCWLGQLLACFLFFVLESLTRSQCKRHGCTLIGRLTMIRHAADLDQPFGWAIRQDANQIKPSPRGGVNAAREKCGKMHLDAEFFL